MKKRPSPKVWLKSAPRRLSWLFLLLFLPLFANVACNVPPQLFSSIEPLPTLAPTLALLPQPPTPLLTPTAAVYTATPDATPTAVPPTPIPTDTPLPTATAVPSYHLILDPSQPQSYLTQFRLVAFYGSPTGPGLGILGELPRDQMHAQLLTTIAEYEPLSDRLILPAYHLVTTVANPHPPGYHHHVSLALIEQWVAEAKELETAVILDIQPGYADLLTEFGRVENLLYEPHVHLAIDPEFTMQGGQIPGVNVGQLYAAQINQIQARLNEIGAAIGLNRVLILHQFLPSMLPDKASIEEYPFVEIVIDGDGVGPAGVKIYNYTTYASEPAFEFGGFKLFPTDGDYPILSPAEVMNLAPQPVLIIYQ
ncbi:MAG: hypothetical protein IPM53_31740 [Anaerolineaceae bacterium]|nr:hypothetical protein [Anaerolineaceae bacterium]